MRNEFGKTFGGYTPLKWNSVSNGNYVADHSLSSFIFSLDLKEKFKLKDANNAIRYHTSYGPMFGNSDFYLCDNCHTSNSSYCGFPTAYEGNNKYERNQQAYTAFGGMPSSYHFRVVEYEVFRVVLEE